MCVDVVVCTDFLLRRKKLIKTKVTFIGFLLRKKILKNMEESETDAESFFENLPNEVR